MSKKSFFFKNFQKKFTKKTDQKITSNFLKDFLTQKSEIIKSFSNDYKNDYEKKNLNKYKKSSHFKVIGMGGSVLGGEAIYDFLNHKIKKKFVFIKNLKNFKERKEKKNFTNLIISKSGNTIETIINSNIHIKKNDKNIFITENKNSYLYNLANYLKAEVIHHNNFIGGRYSVLSEVGMLPAELMGLNPKYFKQFNKLIKNKNFLNSLINNVASIFFLVRKKKFNSIIINYDERSDSLFHWYQQLVAESLGKKNKGVLPIISEMPKDNHSLMQFYLDGVKNNFFTFFYVHDRKSEKIQNNKILKSHKFLKNKNISDITYAQKNATENVFKQKNIPFRTFEIPLRSEKVLGELFSFFVLETVLLGKLIKINPFNQPAVELIKNQTKKLLI